MQPGHRLSSPSRAAASDSSRFTLPPVPVLTVSSQVSYRRPTPPKSRQRGGIPSEHGKCYAYETQYSPSPVPSQGTAPAPDFLRPSQANAPFPCICGANSVDVPAALSTYPLMRPTPPKNSNGADDAAADPLRVWYVSRRRYMVFTAVMRMSASEL
jgi:hypothetical protein